MTGETNNTDNVAATDDSGAAAVESDWWLQLVRCLHRTSSIVDDDQRQATAKALADRLNLPFADFESLLTRFMNAADDRDAGEGAGERFLETSFEHVRAIAGWDGRERAIAKEIETLELSRATYLRIFQAYRHSNPPESHRIKQILLAPVSLLDAKVADFVAWLETVSIVKLATVLGEAAFLFALVSYLYALPFRRQRAIQESRKTIAEQRDIEYSHGRIEALETLNVLCADNAGMQASKAQLSGIDLTQCRRWTLGLASLTQWPLQVRQFHGMDISRASLQEADLSGAQLVEANLEGSNLQGANLQGANLQGANLQGANLQGSNLQGATLEGATLVEANLANSKLNGAIVRSTDFSEANLSGTTGLWTDFSEAYLYRANAIGANFNRSNFQGADLYKVNLTGASMRFTDLRNGTSLREAFLAGTDLRDASFWSEYQLQRGHDWMQALVSENWANRIHRDRPRRLRVGLIRSTEEAIFSAYELGMQRAANREVEVLSVQSGTGVEAEAEAIRSLIENSIDAIVLRPEDPVGSIPAIREAHDAGVVTITVDFCFDDMDVAGLVFACYNTNSFQMGYDSGTHMVGWIETHFPDRDTINIGLVESAIYDRNYPYFEGFMAALDATGLNWAEVASVDVDLRADLDLVVSMLEKNSTIDILWGGSNVATNLAVKAVETLGRQDRTAVFGILDLSEHTAGKLLDNSSPLQSVIDQAGVQIGFEATETAVAILRGEQRGYQLFPVAHRLLTQSDR
ncbi:MAG: pentapeptide repeat-containing protein, partial [Synechococcus sp.]